MPKHTFGLAHLIFPALLCAATVAAQTTPASPKAATNPYAAIPAQTASQPNPVKSSPESLTRAKKWWGLDCVMCHGKNGDGKGELVEPGWHYVWSWPTSAAPRQPRRTHARTG